MGPDPDDRDRNDRGRYDDRIPPDAVLDVFADREDAARPLTAGDIVDALDIARRTAHNKLNALDERGVLDTRKVGARGRVWWTPDRDDTPTDAGAQDVAESERERGVTPSAAQADRTDPPTTSPATRAQDAGEIDATDAVRAAVEAVADGWEDTDARLAARKAAAAAVLQHAHDTGAAVGKSDAAERFLPEYAVDEQNTDTWWRKNVRPVLRAVGEYNQGAHGYVVEDLDP